MAADPVPPPRRRGCLRALLVTCVALVVGAIALNVYVNRGVGAAGEEAQRGLDEIGRALDTVPLFPGSEPDLSSTAVHFAHRYPRDAAEAERAVRAERLGGFIAFFLYCGDQCPSWQPGEAVAEYRSRELRRPPPTDQACEAQRQVLHAAGDVLRPVPPGSAYGTACSFAGCLGRVSVRVDLRADEQEVYGVDLTGAIGDTSEFDDDFPECE